VSFISSPDLEALAQRMAAVDVGAQVARAIFDTAQSGMVSHLQEAAYQAGGSDNLVGSIGIFIAGGQVYVGVPHGPAASEAHTLEYGTSVGAPKGWMRSTIARNQTQYRRTFGNSLTLRFFGGQR
jgi:hypothetical protein